MSDFEFISDLHKDARGHRPSTDWMVDFNSTNEIQQRAIFDGLVDELSYREAEASRRELSAQREYEIRVEGMVTDYSITRGTAMRWDMEAFDVDIESALQYHHSATQEIEYYLYCQGLSFDVFQMYVAEISATLNLG